MAKLVFNYLLILLYLFKFGDAKDPEEIFVKIRQGNLVGEWRKSFHEMPYAAFEGIPYARSPVGKRRFMEPQPPKHWHGIWQATKLPRVCLQWYNLPKDEYGSVVGSEDCLYLNVYSPNTNKSADLPVIVYIHGGSFVFGSGTQYRPTYFMDRGVVFVTINYRLGILGFLSMQDGELPGNNGLKDQSMALQWIQQNIMQFGGNPRSVTLSGIFAGGASVHYHMLSSMSKGLFHRGISQSGTALCPWALQEQPREKALLLAAALGCSAPASSQMMECLRHRPALAIAMVTAMFEPWLHSPFSPFAPVIEPDVKGAFTTRHPYEIVVQGQAQDLPWINSLTAQDGLYPAAAFLKKTEYISYLESNWLDLVPHVFDFNYTMVSWRHAEAAHLIKQFYMQGKPISVETFPGLVKAIGDRHFFLDVEKCTRLQSSKGRSPGYFYYFAYKGDSSPGKFLSSPKSQGVTHGDDGYVMNTIYMDPITVAEDREMVKIMVDIFTTFASNGVPKVTSVDWPPVSVQDGEMFYLEIVDPNNIAMKTTRDLSGAKAFWETLDLKENEMR